MAAMVALVAVDAALASADRMRSNSLPLPLHARDCFYQFRRYDVPFGFISGERRQTRTENG
eukprot:2333668-Pleurochrysis_carterae.AAC.1